jgi:hypothetical protein
MRCVGKILLISHLLDMPLCIGIASQKVEDSSTPIFAITGPDAPGSQGAPTDLNARDEFAA